MKIYERIGLSEADFKILIDTLSSVPNIEEGIIYGSRAKGNYKPFSDVDLTLKGEKLNLRDLISLSEKLEDSPLPYLFDISDFNKITNIDLKDHIIRRGIRIY